VGGARRRKLSIVVVDDDEGVRRLMKLVLVDAGHRVAVFESAEEAIASPSEVARADLFITDLKLPGMSGIDLLTRLASARPAACLLAITGFTLNPTLQARMRALRVNVLEKPFTPDVLVETTERICNKD
jgi:DNA-binding NtrC family response regulator